MVELRDCCAIVLIVLATACRSAGHGAGPQIVQPGAPGQPSRVLTPDDAADLPQVTYTEADVRFMQGMIGHHAQALEMTALVPARTTNEAIRKLALRIELSQADEITMMREWLEQRGEDAPDAHAHHRPGTPLMPGMLTRDEMNQLAQAKGPEFDRLFVALMIKHHEGALVMVRDLFSQPGAGQESEIYAFTSDVEADQRMEIQRMAAMLGEFQK